MRIIFLTILTLSLFACQQQNAPANSVADNNSDKNASAQTAKIQDLDLIKPTEKFTIDASKSQVLETAKLSRIHIPQNAFEHSDGSASGRNVRIEFGEYQTQGEILASGLPMIYFDQKGRKSDFESAGMFEIRAYEGKKELRLKKDKEIKVELASPVDGLFNFYNLDDNTRAWKEEERNLSPVPNRYLDELKAESAKIDSAQMEKPKKMAEYKPSDKVFDIKVDAEQYPEFNEIAGAMWVYKGNNPKEDPAENPGYFSKKYSFVKLVPADKNVYVFNVDFASDKDTITLPMAPVFTGKLKAKNEKKMEEKLRKFAEMSKISEKLRNRERRESQLLRVFNLDKLGIFNYDRQMKDEDAISVLAEFTFGDTPYADAQDMHVFLVPERKLVVIKYDYSTVHDFRINLHERNRLIAIDDDGAMYGLSFEEVAALHLDRFENKKVSVKLKKLNPGVKSAKDVDEVLATL